MNGIWLMNDRANAMGLGDSPDEVGHTGAGHIVCFDGEEMANFMDRKPDSWKTAEPKQEETDKVPSISTRAVRQTIWYVVVARPDGADHECNALSYPVVNKIGRGADFDAATDHQSMPGRHTKSVHEISKGKGPTGLIFMNSHRPLRPY